jgi:hypothetical protein
MSSIVEKIIPTKAYDYESYNGLLYQYTLIKDVPSPTNPNIIIPKGKWYLGAHGSDKLDEINCNVDDGYKQSCRDEDFRLLFCGTEPVFKFEVWYLCKNWSEAKNEENRVLKEYDNGIGAAKSNMSWNQNNGFPTHKQINRKACKTTVDELRKRTKTKWGVNYADKKNYLGQILARIQVRLKDDKDHKKDIKNRINDANGVVDLDKNPDIDPTVIFEKRHSDGRDELIDGNMTSGAICLKDCKAEEVPEIRVPLEDHQHLTDDEVRHISNMLNRKGRKVKKPLNVEDAIKFILDITDNGEREYDTKFNRTMIREDYDLSYDQVNDVMKGVKDSIFKEKQRKINMVLPDYTDEEKQAFVDALKELHTDEIIFYYSAGMSDKMPMKILENIEKDIEDAHASLPQREPLKKVKIVTHYSQSKTIRDLWIKPDIGTWAKLLKRWENIGSDYTITYVEMPLAVKDTK